MRILMSSQARPELRPYVRAYAQRIVEKDDHIVVQSVPAQLEQMLNGEAPPNRLSEGEVSLGSGAYEIRFQVP